MMDNQEYLIYKGLQRPLAFMGLQGRYIGWAAIGAGCSFITFAALFAIFDFWIALLGLSVCLMFFICLIAYKQKKNGLFSKRKKSKGIFVFLGYLKKVKGV
jgi:hypothetical protein